MGVIVFEVPRTYSSPFSLSAFAVFTADAQLVTVWSSCTVLSACSRTFASVNLQDDAPVAVRADADWAEGDEAAAAEAVGTAPPPPGFESAARREHLSEAAALRGRGLTGGASDVEEVGSACGPGWSVLPSEPAWT
jgi:hypothetical protein